MADDARAAGGPRSAGAPAQPIEEIPFRPARAATESGLRGRLLSLAALLVALLFAVALWFVFTARSVQIVVTPAPATLEFDSRGLQFRLQERFLTRPGAATVRATLDGYYPLEETIEVGADDSQVFEFTLARLPGRLLVAFDPPVAAPEIVIDGTRTLAPDGDMVAAGEHELRVTAPRYQPLDTRVTVTGGGVEQTVTLTLTPDWADVFFAAEPVGAVVEVDGERRGVTPVTVEMLAGEHEVRVSAPGYKAWQRPLRVIANQAQAYADIVLARADGTLSLRSTPDAAAVAVDGRYRGQTPLELKLPPGRSYELRLSKAGHAPQSRTVTVRSDQDQQHVFTLQPLFGELRFKLSPPDAEVLVDGEARTLDNGTLSLSAVPHSIEVRAAGYVSVVRDYTPNPDFSQVVDVSLLTFEAAREAALVREITTSEGQRLLLMRPQPFQMGASRRERGRRANEVIREVAGLAEYYIGVHEVTNAQFRRFEPGHDSGKVYQENLNRNDQPVVNISWQQAIRYCNWLSEKDGLTPVYQLSAGVWRPREANGYRLPTEAEWAWAARFAGEQGGPRFSWGNNMPPEAGSGNYADRSAVGLTSRTLRDYNDGYAGTAPVGSFDASPAGLYDMGGNVSEWTQDIYTVGDSALAPEPGGDPLYVIRGAGWMHADIGELRLTFRDFSDRARPDVGFRLARTMEEPEL